LSFQPDYGDKVKGGLAVVPVGSRREREALIRLPWRIYADDPAWVPPLLLNRRRQLSERRNPFFRHAEWQGFLALQNSRPEGRISARIDRLNADLGRPELGYFGLIEGIGGRISKRYHMYEKRLVAPADPTAGT